MKSRHRPVRIETVDFKTSNFHLTCQIKHQTHQILHRIPDNDDSEQLGNIIHDAYKNILNRIPYISQQAVCQPFCLRKYDKDKRYGKQQLQRHQYIPPYTGEKNQQVGLLLRIKQFISLNGDRLYLRILQSQDSCFHFTEQPVRETEK